MANAVKSVSQVSVVIPNYNGKSQMQTHLPDVIALLEDADELIIVDDCSSDNSVEWLITEYGLKNISAGIFTGRWGGKNRSGSILVLVNPTNLRFGATCNRGVAQAEHNYIFLLNTDVSPDLDARNRLLHWFKNPKVFAVGCLEYASSLRHDPSGKNKVWFEKGIFFHAKANDMVTGETAWVSGGSGMFNRKIWQLLGGFDPAFAPAYWEDIDLSWRAHALGYSVLFDASAVVIHQHETTNSITFKKKELLRMSWKSADTFARKHASITQKLQYYVFRPYWWWKRMKVLYADRMIG